MGESLPQTPMNRRTKFDAASFILGEEILNRTNKYARLRPSSGTAVYPHMPILSPHAARTCQARYYGTYSHPELYFRVGGRFVRFWANGGTKFPKVGESLPRTPTKHRTKFDAASFIVAGEIRNRTNTRIHTNKQKQ